MKWTMLHIHGFGRHQQLLLKPDKGLNLIYGPNGSGKTTLWHFMEGLLYGFTSATSKKRTLGPEIKKYDPWFSNEFAGEGELVNQGLRLRLVHHMGKREFHVLEVDKNLDLTQDFINEAGLIKPGEILFQIDQLHYDRLSFYEESLWFDEKELQDFLDGVRPLAWRTPLVERLDQTLAVLRKRRKAWGSPRAKKSVWGELIAKEEAINQSLMAYVDLDREKIKLNGAYDKLISEKPRGEKPIATMPVFGPADYALGKKIWRHRRLPWPLMGTGIIIMTILWWAFPDVLTKSNVSGFAAMWILGNWLFYIKTKRVEEEAWKEAYGQYGIDNLQELKDRCFPSQGEFEQVETTIDLAWQQWQQSMGRLVERRAKWAVEESKRDELLEKRREIQGAIQTLQARALAVDRGIALLTAQRDREIEAWKPRWLHELQQIFEALSGLKLKGIYEDEHSLKLHAKSGKILALQDLSFGERKLFLMAYRFALCKIMEQDTRLPWVMDEPFSHLDEANMASLVDYLVEESKERQIFLMTCREADKDKFKQIANVIELQ